MTDLSDLIAEVGCQVLHLLLVNLQQGSHLGIILRIGLLRIEGNDVTGLGVVEELTLILILDIGRHHHTTLGRDTTLLRITLSVKLTQVTSDSVIATEHVGLHELTSL